MEDCTCGRYVHIKLILMVQFFQIFLLEHWVGVITRDQKGNLLAALSQKIVGLGDVDAIEVKAVVLA